MTHWFEVFRYELRQAFRRKAYLFMTFGIPVLAFVAFYGYQFIQDQTSTDDSAPDSAPTSDIADTADDTNDGDGQVTGYVDLTPEGLFPPPESYPDVNCSVTNDEATALSQSDDPAAARRELIKRTSSPYCMRNQITTFDTFEAGKAALQDGDIDLLVTFDPDYAETGAASAYIESLNLETIDTRDVIENYVIRSLLYNLDSQDYEMIYLRLNNPAFISTRTLTDTGSVDETDEEQGFVLVYAFGLLTMLGIFWGGGYLMQSVVQEKESRIIEIMMSSVQPMALLTGKVLAMGLTALLQIMLLMGTFAYLGAQAGDVIDSLGDLDIEPRMLVFVAVYFVLGFLQFGSLMAAIGAMSTTVREAQNFVVVVTLPAAIPFFLLTVFVEMPDSTLPRLMSMFPLTAPLSMIMRLSVTDVPLGEVAISIALLFVGIAVALWFAGRLFRVNILLSGNMPKLKDIPRLLRS